MILRWIHICQFVNCFVVHTYVRSTVAQSARVRSKTACAWWGVLCQWLRLDIDVDPWKSSKHIYFTHAWSPDCFCGPCCQLVLAFLLGWYLSCIAAACCCWTGCCNVSRFLGCWYVARQSIVCVNLSPRCLALWGRPWICMSTYRYTSIVL